MTITGIRLAESSRRGYRNNVFLCLASSGRRGEYLINAIVLANFAPVDLNDVRVVT